MISQLLFLVLFALTTGVTNSFVVARTAPIQANNVLASSSSSTTTTGSSTSNAASLPATLSKSTTWKLRLVLENAANQNPTTTFSLTGQFLDDEGYEPPQGTFVLANDDDESKVRIASCRWMLSEDPDDRKDGLWIWGLFRFETCFPFMLLTLELQDLSEEEPETMRFYARVPHSRAEDGNVVLDTSPLELQRLEQMNADPMGFAKVEILDSVPVGRISFFPVTAAEKE